MGVMAIGNAADRMAEDLDRQRCAISNLARYPSVVFKVFIDGKEAAASPVMRVQSLAWRFDVPLPVGARMISLAVADAGDGSREDSADWADAGFLVRK